MENHHRNNEISHEKLWFSISWLVVYLPLWKMMEFVSWDDDIPNIWKNNPNVPNHQSDSYVTVYQMLYPIKSPLNPIKPPFSYGFPMVFLWLSYGFSEGSLNGSVAVPT